MIRKLRHIITGWLKRSGILSISTPEAKMAELRMRICRSCSESEPSKVLRILKGVPNYDKILQCTACSCPCEEKTVITDESCPLKLW